MIKAQQADLKRDVSEALDKIYAVTGPAEYSVEANDVEPGVIACIGHNSMRKEALQILFEIAERYGVTCNLVHDPNGNELQMMYTGNGGLFADESE